MTVTPIVVDTLEVVPKGLEKRPREVEICRRIENIQTTAQLGYLEASCISKKTCHSDSSEKLTNNKIVIVKEVEFRALETVSKNMKKRLEELEIRSRIETIQTTALLKSASILRRVLEK